MRANTIRSKQYTYLPTSSSYFIMFLGFASLFPFLSLYYESLGLTGRQIGMLMAIPPFIRIFATSIWGGIADITQKPHRILTVAFIGTAVAGYSISQGRTFAVLLPLVILYAIMVAPVIPLLDSSTMQLLNGKTQMYGRLRTWGSIGWIIGTILFGYLIDQSGNYQIGFNSFLICIMLTVLISLKLPPGQTKKASYWRTLSQLFADKRWYPLIAQMLVYGLANTVAISFLGLRLREVGASNVLIGIAFAVGTASEIVVFYYGEQIRARWSAYTMIMVALSFAVVRTVFTGIIDVPYLILLLQLTHGIVFGLVWIAAVPYTYEIAPPNLKATAQSMISIAIAIGSIIGSMIGGHLIDVAGIGGMFQVMGVIIAVAVIGLYLFFRPYKTISENK